MFSKAQDESKYGDSLRSAALTDLEFWSTLQKKMDEKRLAGIGGEAVTTTEIIALRGTKKITDLLKAIELQKNAVSPQNVDHVKILKAIEKDINDVLDDEESQKTILKLLAKDQTYFNLSQSNPGLRVRARDTSNLFTAAQEQKESKATLSISTPTLMTDPLLSPRDNQEEFKRRIHAIKESWKGRLFSTSVPSPTTDSSSLPGLRS